MEGAENLVAGDGAGRETEAPSPAFGVPMSSSRLSDRALAIVAGLARSGRISVMPPGSMTFWRGYARLDRISGGGFYWVAADGSTLKRGRDVTEAESLAPGFVQAMVRLGAPRQSAMEIPALEPKSSLAAISA